jgi:diguanylate cyclase (GGDEF)-like protein
MRVTSKLQITDLQKRLILDHGVRKLKLKIHKNQILSLRTNVDQEIIESLKREVLTFERYLNDDKKSGGAIVLSDNFEQEKKSLETLEVDLSRLRSQVGELPLGSARDELLLVLNKLEGMKEPLQRLKELNQSVKKLLKLLGTFIQREIELFETEFNLLVMIGEKDYSNVSNIVEELIVNINTIETNFEDEEAQVIEPLKALLNQKTETHKKIEELEAALISEEKLETDKIKEHLRSLNPLQAKEYLETLQILAINYSLEGKNIDNLGRIFGFVQRFKRFFDRKRAKIESEKRIQGVQEKNALKELTRIDPLLGLKNRRAMDEECITQIKQMFRNGGVLGFMMIDLDRFKEVNDTWGHPIGDIALKTTARALKENLRPGDNVYRYGGEEIAILLPDVKSEEFLLRAGERMRTAIFTRNEEEKIKNNPYKVLGERRITASFGAVCVHFSFSKEKVSDERAEEIFTQIKTAADKMLYKAKENGRNQVRITRIDI